MNTRKSLHHAAALSLVCLSLLASGVQAADRVVPGQWQSVMVTDGESKTIAYCLNAEQAAATNADTRTGRDYAEKKAGSRCAVKSYEANGDTVSYSMLCGTRTISDTTHFHGTTSEGVKTTSLDGKSVATDIKSHRTGACP